MTIFEFIFKIYNLRFYKRFELAYFQKSYNFRIITLSQSV